MWQQDRQLVLHIEGETEEQMTERALAMGNEQRQQEKANQPQKVRMLTDHEQADAYMRTPDSADYWDIEGKGGLVPE